jgi:hypothetical protein
MSCGCGSRFSPSKKTKQTQVTQEMDGKLVLKIVYTDSYRTIAFDNDATVAQAMQILKQVCLVLLMFSSSALVDIFDVTVCWILYCRS